CCSASDCRSPGLCLFPYTTLFRSSLLAVPPINLFGALAMTILGFIALLGYEWSASRYAEVQLPKRILALGGFCAFAIGNAVGLRSEEHTSELQSRENLVCRLLLEK